MTVGVAVTVPTRVAVSYATGGPADGTEGPGETYDYAGPLAGVVVAVDVEGGTVTVQDGEDMWVCPVRGPMRVR